MKRGPKPKPTALKVLEGVHPFRINGDEPSYVPATDEAPEWLTGLALVHWRELAPVLVSGRVFSVGDRSNLALLCLLYQQWRDDPSDLKVVNQYVRLSLEFGLTPSSRSRIKVSPEKPADEAARLDEFLNGRKAQ